jgi:hypothetical protein
VRLVTTAEFLDLLGAEPAEPAEPEEPEEPERPGYAPASAADIVSAATRLGWLSDGRWLYPVVPAAPPRR